LQGLKEEEEEAKRELNLDLNLDIQSYEMRSSGTPVSDYDQVRRRLPMSEIKEQSELNSTN